MISVFIAAQPGLAANIHAKADDKQSAPAMGVDRVVATAKHKILKEKTRQIEADALTVVSETPKAIIALEKKDTKTAKEILQGVSGKLDSILAKNPSLSLIPADVRVNVVEYEGNSKTIAKTIDAAKDLLKIGKLQEARQILIPMASEIRVSILKIPLGTFPGVIKQSITLIDSGKIDQAAVALDDGLNTFVETIETMPLPVLRAEELMTAATELEHTKDMSQQQIRDEIQQYTGAAKENLKIAQLFGYGGNDDYTRLYKEIDALDHVLFTEKSADVWGRIKARFADLKAVIGRIGQPAK